MRNSEDFASHIERIFIAAPCATAIETSCSAISWGELKILCDAITSEFELLGLEAGSPVGVVARNQIGHIAALISIISSGRCFATINPFQPSEGLSQDISEMKPPVVILAEEDAVNPSVLTTIRSIGSTAIILMPDNSISVIRPGPGKTEAKSEYALLPGIAVLMLTSGTTGRPKRIRLTLRSLISATTSQLSRRSSDSLLEVKSTPTLISNPISHISGLFFVVSSIMEARPIVILERFSVEYWADMVEKHRIRYTSIVPAAIRMVYDSGLLKSKLSSLSALGSGASSLPVDLQRTFEEKYDIPILLVYGATEFSGAIAGWTLPLHKSFIGSKIGSVGRAFDGVDLRVVDSVSGEQLPSNESGVLEVRGSQFDSEGSWTRTTDIAVIDDDAFVWIKGRTDAAINRGGFKILPEEIEAILRQFPPVADAVVVGIEDDRLGEVPVAAVELRPTMTASDEEILDYLRGSLPSYKVPVRIISLPELPRSGALKVRIKDVKDLFEQ